MNVSVFVSLCLHLSEGTKDFATNPHGLFPLYFSLFSFLYHAKGVGGPAVEAATEKYLKEYN